MPQTDYQSTTNAIKKEIIHLHTQIPKKDTAPSRSGNSSEGSMSDLAEEWETKYERLVEAHKKLQNINISLEEKLLKVVEKFEIDKNIISRDLSTQTQRVVEGKLTIQQLHKENSQLRSDLQIALNLLQMKPNSFISQKLDSLPNDLKTQVKAHSADKTEERRRDENGGQKITISIPNSALMSGKISNHNDSVSAAILAKVLEERENERKKQQTFRIDIGTQTHGWRQFSDNFSPCVIDPAVGSSSRQTVNRNISTEDSRGYNLCEEVTYENNSLNKKACLPMTLASTTSTRTSPYTPQTHVSNILLSSIIQVPNTSHVNQQYNQEKCEEKELLPKEKELSQKEKELLHKKSRGQISTQKKLHQHSFSSTQTEL